MAIVSKPATKDFRKNFDKVFSKRQKEKDAFAEDYSALCEQFDSGSPMPMPQAHHEGIVIIDKVIELAMALRACYGNGNYGQDLAFIDGAVSFCDELINHLSITRKELEAGHV